MKASIVDLRYKMNDVLKALQRNEEVIVLYRGQEIAVMTPIAKAKLGMNVEDHPFYGSAAEDERSVDEVIKKLREGRVDDV